jgi:hypothetical protein
MIAWKIFRDLAVDRNAIDQIAPNNPVVLQTNSNCAMPTSQDQSGLK